MCARRRQLWRPYLGDGPGALPRLHAAASELSASMMRGEAAQPETAAEVRAVFERDGFYIWRGLLSAATLAPLQQQLEERVEQMAAQLAAARADAGAPPRSPHAKV
eukprot:COSAG01_NODE_22239_length_864_cov_87.962092_1_plen_106_part_00